MIMIFFLFYVVFQYTCDILTTLDGSYCVFGSVKRVSLGLGRLLVEQVTECFCFLLPVLGGRCCFNDDVDVVLFVCLLHSSTPSYDNFLKVIKY